MSQSINDPNSLINDQPTDLSEAQSMMQLYDALIFHVCDTPNISRDDQVRIAKEYYPNFNDHPLHDNQLSEQNLTMYAEARGVGMSLEDAAHASDFSARLIKKVLTGADVSLEKFIEIIKVELFVLAHTQRQQLVSLAVAGVVDHKAAETALSNIMPYDYGKHKRIESEAEDDIHMTFEEYTGENPNENSHDTDTDNVTPITPPNTVPN